MAGLSSKPRPNASVWRWGTAVVCIGRGLNADGIAGIVLDAGLKVCIEWGRTRGLLVCPCTCELGREAIPWWACAWAWRCMWLCPADWGWAWKIRSWIGKSGERGLLEPR
jgi:hypothetical protein